MKTRRRFTAEFKAKVALEAMQGHGTITDLASRHELHPNLIMQWKRQAIEKLAKVFDDKAPEIQAGRDAEMTKLHAKIGQLAWNAIFGGSLRSLSLDRRRTMIDPDHPRLSIVRQCELASVAGVVLSGAGWRARGEPRSHAAHRRGISRLPVLRRAPDDATSALPRLEGRPQTNPPTDAQDRPRPDLSSAKNQRAASTTQGLPVSVEASDHRAARPGLVRRCQCAAASGVRDGVRSPAIGFPQVANHRKRRWSKARVVSVTERALQRRQVGDRKANTL